MQPIRSELAVSRNRFPFCVPYAWDTVNDPWACRLSLRALLRGLHYVKLTEQHKSAPMLHSSTLEAENISSPFLARREMIWKATDCTKWLCRQKTLKSMNRHSAKVLPARTLSWHFKGTNQSPIRSIPPWDCLASQPSSPNTRTESPDRKERQFGISC